MVNIEHSQDLAASSRIRGFGLPKLALRQRSAEHPMIMFALIVLVAFAAMLLVSPTGAAFATSTAAPAAAPKGERLAMAETDIACRGQAWGAESAACLAVIAKESGRAETRVIRVIPAGEQPSSAPNVF